MTAVLACVLPSWNFIIRKISCEGEILTTGIPVGVGRGRGAMIGVGEGWCLPQENGIGDMRVQNAFYTTRVGGFWSSGMQGRKFPKVHVHVCKPHAQRTAAARFDVTCSNSGS